MQIGGCQGLGGEGEWKKLLNGFLFQNDGNVLGLVRGGSDINSEYTKGVELFPKNG